MSDWWNEIRYFTEDEFRCSHTGECDMDRDYVARLDELRDRCGFGFTINSGYRHESHPEEAKKDKPGRHNAGTAADIRVQDGVQRRAIVAEAIAMGFGGIGVATGYVHVDDRDTIPVIWTY